MSDPTFTAAQLRLLAGYAQGRIATALRFAARLVERTTPMQSDGDNFLFTDEFGTVWRLKRTGDYDMPLIITPVSKRSPEEPR